MRNENHNHRRGPKPSFSDPVCGMATDREDKFLRHDYHGRAYYFCSERLFHF
ncbi:MAG TPA: hypothetical protein DDY20_11570 [Desulfobulbaceae bacterium]|nr:hypothetical protein [Desulfobulbaceae bacterium]